MFQRIIATDRSVVSAVLRIALGIVILPHGAQKLFGWFGGGGLGGTFEFFSSGLGIPALITGLVIAGESLGALALIVGFLSRAAATAIAVIMAGAVFIVHAPNGFFMNWTGAQAGEGFEYHVLAIGIALAVIVRGGGAWSLDRWLGRPRHARRQDELRVSAEARAS